MNVAVDQRFRGQGVGRMLISAAVRTAAQRLMAKRLYTHVDCDNEAAWRLYQQQGFDIYDDAACSLPGAVLEHSVLKRTSLATANRHWCAGHAMDMLQVYIGADPHTCCLLQVVG